MLAGAVTVIAATLNFPNGGGGFSGYNGALVHIPQIRRPSFAGTDPAYYRFSVIVAIVMFLLVYAHLRTRPGRAWAAIRQSEPAALAAGINTTFYKLWAMALAAFVTGVAGALLAGADRYLYSIDFPIQNSITLLAVVLMGGVFSLAGAVIAAFLQCLPARDAAAAVGRALRLAAHLVRRRRHAGARHRAGGIADQFPKDMKRLYRLIRRLVSRPAPASSAGTAPGRGARRHDRGQGPDGQVRRRHLARRHEHRRSRRAPAG